MFSICPFIQYTLYPYVMKSKCLLHGQVLKAHTYCTKIIFTTNKVLTHNLVIFT